MEITVHRETAGPGVEAAGAGGAGRWAMGHSSAVQVLDRAEFLRALQVLDLWAAARWKLAVVLFDINGFESVNHAFGTACADRLLILVAEAITGVAGPGAVVGNVGGDRFGVLRFVQTADEAADLARQLCRVAARPFPLGPHQVSVTMRAGVSVLEHEEGAGLRALRYATAALAEAKSTGATVFCAPADWPRVDRRALIRRALPAAIESDQLRLVYQPVVSLRAGGVVGYEALLRWRALGGIDIPPDECIPVAEELGLIHEIGRWVLDRAVATAGRLNASGAAPVAMAVNLSPRQFTDPDLVLAVRTALLRHRLNPSLLALEITESVAVTAPDARTVVGDLRGLGCHVGLDDFGTGQSCLSYLRLLPVDFLKIDRSFVSELCSDERAVRLVETITTLAHDLGLTTVAEGIESEAQHRAVAAAGCTHGQGYFLGVPAPPEELFELDG